MSLVLNVEILGEFKKLTAATQGANNQLQTMGDKAKKISGGIKSAFLAIGVGLSFKAIAQGFEETTKAAEREIKGRNNLTLAIENNTDATASQIKEVHKYIAATEVASAVNDDVLRPALGSLIRATGDTNRAMKLMDVAMDVAAGTGKDLGSISEAMSKALNGNVGALRRLVPTLNDTEDPMIQLERAFKGANEEAAKQKTWERFEIIMGNIKEMVGEILLPVLNRFSEWFQEVYPKIQDFFKALNDPTTSLGKVWQNFGAILSNTADQFNKMLAVFGVSGIKFEDVLGFVNMLTAGFGQLFFMVGRVAEIIGAIITLDFNKAFKLASTFGQDYSSLVASQNRAMAGPMIMGSEERRAQNVTININQGNITAQEIAEKVNRANRATGTNLIRNT
jgi:hypothetical protein